MDASVIIMLISIVCVIAMFIYIISYRKKEAERIAEALKSSEKSLPSADDKVSTISSKGNNVEDELIKERADFEAEKSKLLKKIKSLETELDSANAVSSGNADTKKLQADIKKLKQKLEDAEDDLDDANSKFKKEKARLESSLEEKDVESKKLLEANSLLEEEKKVLSKSISNKKQSLEFVQEVLTADETSDTKYKNLDQNVNEIKSFIEGELYSFIHQIQVDGFLKDFEGSENIDFANGWTKEDELDFGAYLEHWAHNTKKSWLNGKTTVALIGEFSAGKTSIVNRLLSQDKPNVPTLPVSTKETTAIPTYISGGDKTYYQFYTPDNKLKSISQDTFTKVNKEVLDEVKGVSQMIKYFVMAYNNPMLNGLSVLDTPGFEARRKNNGKSSTGSNDSKEDFDDEASIRTLEVINECDALFWVVDVNHGEVHSKSLKLIKEKLTKPLFVVINKIDTKSRTEVDEFENKLKSTFSKAEVSVKGFIRFSQEEPLSVISQPLQNVKSSQKKEDYLAVMGKKLRDLEEYLRVNKQDWQKNFNERNKFIEEQFDIYVNSFKGDIEMAEYAKSIPHFEEHFFSSDQYEMSIGEYDRLKDALNSLCEDLDETYKCFPNLIEKVKEAQQVAGILDNFSDYYSQTKMLLGKFQQLVNKLNK